MRLRAAFSIVAALIAASSDVFAATQTATVNGAQLSYEVCGDPTAQGVVLVHDGLANSALWDEVWEPLCAKYRVLRYDRRGYGKSPLATFRHSPAGDLAGVMRAAGLTHAHFIGSSLGAGIVLDFVFENPEAIDRLVLVSPIIPGYAPNDSFMDRLRAIDEVVRKGDVDATIATLQADPFFLAPENTKAHAKLGAILKESPGDLGSHPFQMRPTDTALRLGEIYTPTLIILGANDHPYIQAMGATINKGLRAGSLHLALNAGQLVYLDQPAYFVGLVTDFLK